MKFMIDNKFAISLANNPISHRRSKHIEKIFYFIREQVMKGMIEVIHYPTKEKFAVGFTKTVKIKSFE